MIRKQGGDNILINQEKEREVLSLRKQLEKLTTEKSSIQNERDYIAKQFNIAQQDQLLISQENLQLKKDASKIILERDNTKKDLQEACTKLVYFEHNLKTLTNEKNDILLAYQQLGLEHKESINTIDLLQEELKILKYETQ